MRTLQNQDRSSVVKLSDAEDGRVRRARNRGCAWVVVAGNVSEGDQGVVLFRVHRTSR